MKAVLVLAASLSLASASILPRQLDQLPPCALECALPSIGQSGCPSTDFSCICQATAFIEALLPCVQTSCTAAEIERTVQAASGLCAAAGVTLSVPPIATETGAPSSSAAASTEAPMTETSSAPVTEATETSSAPMTEATETTMAPATTMAGNNTRTTATSPPTPTGTEPGAASRNTVALGGLGAIVALVAAFL